MTLLSLIGDQTSDSTFQAQQPLASQLRVHAHVLITRFRRSLHALSTHVRSGSRCTVNDKTDKEKEDKDNDEVEYEDGYNDEDG